MDDDLRPGQIRYAAVKIPQLRPHEDGHKERPVILLSIDPLTGWWRIMGLTTLTHYGDNGGPRVRFVEPEVAGLDHTFLWGRPTKVPEEDIYELKGVLTQRGVDQLLDEIPELTSIDVACLWDSLP